MTQTPEQQPNPTHSRLESGELTDDTKYKIEVEREDPGEQRLLVDIKMPDDMVYSLYDVSADGVKESYGLPNATYSHIITQKKPNGESEVVAYLDAEASGINNPAGVFTSQDYVAPTYDHDLSRNKSSFHISFRDTDGLTLKAVRPEQGSPVVEVAQYYPRLTESDEQELHGLLEELSEELPSTAALTDILSAHDDATEDDEIFRKRFQAVDEVIRKNTGEFSKEHIRHVITVMFHDIGKAYASQEGETTESVKSDTGEVSEPSEVTPEPESPPAPETPATSAPSPERRSPELSEEDKQWLLENNRLLYWTRKEQGSDAAIYDYKSGHREVDEPQDYAVAKKVDEAVRNDGSPYKFKGYIDAIIEITDANGEVRSIRVIGKTPYHEDNKDRGYIVLPTGDHERQNRLQWSGQLPVDSVWDYLLSEMPPNIYDDFTHHADITDGKHKFAKMNFEYDARQVQAGQAKLELKNIEI